MKNIETIVCLDKSRIQFSEYQKFKEQEQYLAKRIYELQSDLSREKSKVGNLEQQIEQLEKRICELQSDLSKAKSMNEKMKCCANCVNQTKNEFEEPCWSCHNRSEWRLAE